MKNNDGRQKQSRTAIASALLVGGLALTSGSSRAATAVGTASATVVGSVAVIVTVPAPVPPPAVVAPTPALSGTVFKVESFTESLSTSGPLLRVGVAPPAGTGGSGVQSGGATDGSATQGATAAQAGEGAAPPAASTATVNVTRKADGSLSVSGGSGLTIAVSQPASGAVNIEYN
jgi:hypothetical protein